jgi:ABC-2 type transport system permease protein
MSSIFNISLKDIQQMVRDRKTFLFLLIMPIAFTIMFGFAFSGSNSKTADNRLQVGWVNQDQDSNLSKELQKMLSQSTVIRLIPGDVDSLQTRLVKKEITASIIIPNGYAASMLGETPMPLTLWVDSSTNDGLSAKTEVNVMTSRLLMSVQTARQFAPEGGASFNAMLQSTLQSWQNPPVRIRSENVIKSDTGNVGSTENSNKFSHSSPGMLLQFAVAGLMTCANVIIAERKNHCLERLMTTATNRVEILIGHYFAIFLMILLQFIILILFGDLVLKLNYHSQLLASLLIAVTAALCIAALGLLIGIGAKSEEQAIAISMICMFLLSGLGGAWVPLEITGKTFQTIGHLSPLAWGMDGFENILSRGLGIGAAWLPAAALLGYAILFFTLAAWKFKSE